jgi:DNA (cytosine-5)-methyltransferase 1
MKKINLLDLFSGIGGFHLGLEKAGFKVNSYNSEIDKYANQVYKHNFKNSNYVGSVTDVRGSELPRINAITFGSPCQDFSIAGSRKGMGGERSSLITEAIRLIEECRPDFFIWENVKGAFSSNNRQDFAAILQAFANIGGYRLEWQLLNTKWFLPQNRERIYLVGYIGNKRRGQVFPIRESLGNSDEMAKTRQTSSCITASYHKGLNFDNQLIASSRGRNPNNVSDRSKGAHLKQKLEINKEKISNTLTSVQKDNYVVKIGDYRNDDGYRERKDGDSPCLSARRHSEKDISTMPAIVDRIRRLTPMECERLQGFPDNWTKYGTKGIISDTQRYKMCGNAVTVDVVAAVANNIKKLF